MSDTKQTVSKPKPKDLLALLFNAEHKYSLIAVGLLSLFSALTALGQPVLVSKALNQVGPNLSLNGYVYLLVGLVILSSVFLGGQQYLLQKLGEQVVLRARNSIIDAILKLRISNYDSRSGGDLISRVNADTTILRVALIQAITTMFSGLLIIVGAMVAMIIISWELTLITLAVVLGSILIVTLLGAVVQKSSLENQEALGALSSGLHRSLSAIRTIRAVNATNREILVLQESARSAQQTGLKMAKFNAIISPVSGLCTQVAVLLVIGLGGYWVSKGTLAVGDLVTFIMFLIMLIMPLGQTHSAIASLGQALGAYGRITEVLDLPKESDLSELPPESKQHQIRGELSFQNVSFKYATHDANVLHNVSFDAAAGSRVAIVGPSGAGKSTILQLIEKFYDPSSGQILLDGKDLQTYPNTALRAHLGYVEQDSPVLSGTLRQNLLLASPKASDTELEQVLHDINLQHLLQRESSGLDVELGDGGVTLSGGEKQRLALARVLLSDAKVFLLDETTSNLDGNNEQLMRLALDRVAPGRTMIIVAHRLATVVDADQIIVLERGRIVGIGKHHELLNTVPLYESLAQSQLLT